MVLLLGKNGYVSKRFQDFFNYKQIDFTVISLRDLQSPYNIINILRDLKPKYVINCIGYTGVPNIEACENNKQECLYVNVVLQEIIADACKKWNIPMGYVSSGCIYQEHEISYWHEFNETDFPNFSFAFKNCSWYSGTKALGESVVTKSWEKVRVFRLRMPFNHIPSDKNLISKFLKYPKIWSYPNSISNLDEFVKACYLSMEKEIPYGIYNLTNPGSITAKEILDYGKIYEITKPVYEYFKNIEEFKQVTSSPRSDCVLRSDKILESGIELLNIHESVDTTFRNWNQDTSFPFWN